MGMMQVCFSDFYYGPSWYLPRFPYNINNLAGRTIGKILKSAHRKQQNPYLQRMLLMGLLGSPYQLLVT